MFRPASSRNTIVWGGKTVEKSRHSLGRVLITGGIGLLVASVALCVGSARESKAGPLDWLRSRHAGKEKPCASDCHQDADEWAGTWYWLRSPDEEKRVTAAHFNRYCIRCHGVDGRGAWDIPGVPDFTNARWQASRSDGDRARIILEGRGAVMPPFRGTLTLEEAWAMGRYLHSFDPSTVISRPDLKKPSK
jgi:hypothetical protein